VVGVGFDTSAIGSRGFILCQSEETGEPDLFDRAHLLAPKLYIPIPEERKP
jgi:hypothetical protein